MTLLLPETVKINSFPSTSPMYPAKSSTRLSSSAKMKVSGKVIVGGSFTGITVSTNVSVAVSNKSLTVTKIFAIPL